MRMTETELFDYLNKVFPEKIIYTDQYRLGAYLSAFADVRKYAKAEGLSSAQWLTNRGFIWRETGYVESDMRIRNTHELSPECSAFDLADYVFRTKVRQASLSASGNSHAESGQRGKSGHYHGNWFW